MKRTDNGVSGVGCVT